MINYTDILNIASTQVLIKQSNSSYNLQAVSAVKASIIDSCYYQKVEIPAALEPYDSHLNQIVRTY